MIEIIECFTHEFQTRNLIDYFTNRLFLEEDYNLKLKVVENIGKIVVKMESHLSDLEWYSHLVLYIKQAADSDDEHMQIA